MFVVLAQAPASVQNQQAITANGNITAVVLTFSKGMNPTRATDLTNYSIQIAGRSTGDRPASAVYDPSLRTATLVLRSPVPTGTGILLTVRGTNPCGLTDLHSQLLDGNADGLAGGNFVVRFGGPHRRTTAALAQRARPSAFRLSGGPRG